MFNVLTACDIKKVLEHFNFEGKVKMFELHTLKYNCIKSTNYFFQADSRLKALNATFRVKNPDK